MRIMARFHHRMIKKSIAAFTVIIIRTQHQTMRKSMRTMTHFHHQAKNEVNCTISNDDCTDSSTDGESDDEEVNAIFNFTVPSLDDEEDFNGNFNNIYTVSSTLSSSTSTYDDTAGRQE